MKKIDMHNHLESLLPGYARPQMALVDFMKMVKDEKDSISPADVTALSKICEVKADQIIKIMDRYPYFSDAKEQPIYVCMGLPCYVNGAENLLDEILSEQEKLNGQARGVKTSHCLGYCFDAPVARLGDGSDYRG